MRQTIVTVVLLVLLAAAGYVWFTYLREPPGDATAPAALGLTEERLEEYRQLKNLKFDSSVFTDPLFQELARPVSSRAPSTPGRSNPFAPF